MRGRDEQAGRSQGIRVRAELTESSLGTWIGRHRFCVDSGYSFAQPPGTGQSIRCGSFCSMTKPSSISPPARLSVPILAHGNMEERTPKDVCNEPRDILLELLLDVLAPRIDRLVCLGGHDRKVASVERLGW